MEIKIVQADTGAFIYTVAWSGGQHTGEAGTLEEAKAHLRGWLQRQVVGAPQG